MRTLLNEIKLAEDYLANRLPADERLVFEARLLIDPALKGQIAWQKKTYGIVREYSRKKLKEEIAAVHQIMFTKPVHQDFRDRIMRLFKPAG